MRIGDTYVGLGEGDESDEVGKIIDYVRRMYTPARNTVAPGRLFTPALTSEIKREQEVFVSQGKLKGGEFIPGVVNLAWKYASGYLKKDKLLPLYFSAEGHMSDMNVGPVAWVGQVLHNEGRALHFPTFYVNNAIPFKTRTGITELARRVGQTVQDNGVKFPEGTPWALGGFSEGGLLISKFYLEYLMPGKPLNWRLKDLRGVICCGSPYREKGVVAEWIPDPPASDRQGISDVRLTDTPWWWKEVARHGDLYTDNESSGDRALYKTMCYKIIAEGSFSGGKAGFLARVMDLLTPSDDLIPVALAIFDGLKFLTNMSPHGIYNMDPAVQFLRERLAA
jgi:hypothetical protein